jgi:hypothetical protein
MFSPSRLHVAIVRSVRLFAVPVRATALSKSRDEISVRGRAVTPLVCTVAATVL